MSRRDQADGGMHIYLDIDGVLLGKDPRTGNLAIAAHAAQFVTYCLEVAEVYWATTHCHEGDAGPALGYLEPYGDLALLDLLHHIRPTSWRTLKTEAMDLAADFLWFDDAPLQAELTVLREHDVLDRWVKVNTRKNYDALGEALRFLEGPTRH